MDHVRSPEETALVAGAVKPVIAEVVGTKGQDPGPPLVAYLEYRESMHPGKQGEDHGLGNESDQYVTHSHGQAGSGVLRLIKIPAHYGVEDGLNHHQNDE